MERKYTLVNKTIGKEYVGVDLVELYELAMCEGSPRDIFKLYSKPVKVDSDKYLALVDYMMERDPNGMWDDTADDDLTEKEVLECMLRTITRWASEESNQLVKAKYYKKLMEIEELL